MGSIFISTVNMLWLIKKKLHLSVCFFKFRQYKLVGSLIIASFWDSFTNFEMCWWVTVNLDKETFNRDSLLLIYSSTWVLGSGKYWPWNIWQTFFSTSISFENLMYINFTFILTYFVVHSPLNLLSTFFVPFLHGSLFRFL